MHLKENYHFDCNCQICRHNPESSELEQAVGGEFAATVSSDEELNQILGALRELQIECHQNLTAASTMAVAASDNEEEDPRTNYIEQCIATLHMAQRGTRNNKIPSSHEVSLECNRLLAVAYSLLRETQEDAIDEEWMHHEEFLKAVEKARPLMDPSALAIQHHLAASCLQAKRNNSEEIEKEEELWKQQEIHRKEAIRLAKFAVGEDHAFLSSLQLPLSPSKNGNDAPTLTTSDSNEKRKLDP